ncbi:MAG: M15 family metallopeptidase [Erysipelothrix sp.]|nr:M15 family metallopeptidase [Erysipelothrix sp.]
MSESKLKKKRHRKGSRKVRRTQRLLMLLVSMVFIVLIIQVQAHLLTSDENTIDYTSLLFESPLKTSLEIVKISDHEGESLFNNQTGAIEYSDIKNYIEENNERYKAYHALHETLLTAEVVWRVNVGLDIEDYSQVVNIEDPQSYTSVINKNRRLSSGYTYDDLVSVGNSDVYLREEAAMNFENLLSQLKDADINIEITSGYLSEDDVAENYEALQASNPVDDTDYRVIKVGHDEHQLGLALDIDTADGSVFLESDLHVWLRNNAHRFGFIFRYDTSEEVSHYQSELKHLRFVGEDVAIDMYEKNIKNLEEYLDKHAQ